jgi:hypothetical protein
MNSTTAAAATTTALGQSSSLSALEERSLEGLTGPDKERAKAQLMLQKQQETVNFVSNVLKKLNEVAMHIIGKIA